MIRGWGVLILAAALHLPGGPSLADETAEVNADVLSVDHEHRSAHFEGHVRGTVGGLRLRCDKLDLTYDEAGEVVSLVATGRVAVSHGENNAAAGTARLDAKKGILILEGKPSLTRGPNRLEGRRITFHLKSGRLDVEGAKGTFILKKVDGK